MYVVECTGVDGGYSQDALQHLSNVAKKHQVNAVLIESNFGDGMFTELLKPILNKTYSVTIEEVRHSKQKELRIIDTLEPILNQHRLIIDPKVIKEDYDSVQKYPAEQAQRYMLTYQLSRVTRDRGSLAHDDRLDVLAMAVKYYVDQMAADVNLMMDERKEEVLRQELDKFIGGFNIGNKGGHKPLTAF